MNNEGGQGMTASNLTKETYINNTLFYSTKDLHKLTSVPLKTIQEWASKGRIPGQIRMGHFWRFKKVAIDKALESDVFLNGAFE